MRANHDQVKEPKAPSPPDQAQPETPRCRRCDQLLIDLERETYFARTGMCFWCAYVDSQG